MGADDVARRTGTCHAPYLGFIGEQAGQTFAWLTEPSVWSAEHTWVACEAIGPPAFGENTTLPPPRGQATKPRRASYEPVHVYFVGAARDAARFIAPRATHIEALGAQFEAYNVLIWEDGSVDSTRLELEAWAKRNRRVGLLLPSAPWLFAPLGRPNRLAFARNILLAEALKHQWQHEQHSYSWKSLQNQHPPRQQAPHRRHQHGAHHQPPGRRRSGYHHIMVAIDLDCEPALRPGDLEAALRLHMVDKNDPEPSSGTPHRQPKPLRPMQYGGTQSAAAAISRWDVLTANSLSHHGLYYDIWALRSKALRVEHDCSVDKLSVAALGGCGTWAIDVNTTAPMVPVDSAFNGLAAYRLDRLRTSGCHYGGAFTLTCEHVGFHACLRRKNVSIAIAPSLAQGCGRGVWNHPGRRNVVRVNRNGTVWVNLTHVPYSHQMRSVDIAWMVLQHRWAIRHGAIAPQLASALLLMATLCMVRCGACRGQSIQALSLRA